LAGPRGFEPRISGFLLCFIRRPASYPC